MVPEPATPPDTNVRLITVSASNGACGSVVAPALAERLGLPFLQRVTNVATGHVAEPGPCDEQLSTEEVKTTPAHRLLAGLISRRKRPPGPPSRRRPPTTRTATCATAAKPGSIA